MQEKAKEILHLFAWEEIRPDEFKLRIGKALLEQAKQQETLEYCQNWYEENENNWLAATALVSALSSRFQLLSPTERQVSHALLTRSPLSVPEGTLRSTCMC